MRAGSEMRSEMSSPRKVGLLGGRRRCIMSCLGIGQITCLLAKLVWLISYLPRQQCVAGEADIGCDLNRVWRDGESDLISRVIGLRQG
jgi:hypothetical protein